MMIKKLTNGVRRTCQPFFSQRKENVYVVIEIKRTNSNNSALYIKI